jgi:hypothetical protein
MTNDNTHETVFITQFKWSGKLGPFSIKTSCDECDLTTSILQDMLKNEFKNKNVTFEVKPWLDNFFYCIVRFAWHPPIIIVNGKKFYQFNEKEPLFNREKLAALVKNYLG